MTQWSSPGCKGDMPYSSDHATFCTGKTATEIKVPTQLLRVEQMLTMWIENTEGCEVVELWYTDQ